jgi:hypothetical protein
MAKTVIRYFIDFIDGQEKWLNKMANQGLRLVSVGKAFYRFEDCKPGEYQYRVEFAANKTYPQKKNYKVFLEELGCRVFCKNVNLNWSFGKARFRPWSDGKFATSPGEYNTELLIIEKRNDDKPFEIHTDAKDAAAYFGSIRNACLMTAVFAVVLALLGTPLLAVVNMPLWGSVVFGFVGVLSFGLAVKYGMVAGRYRELGKTNE